MTRPSADASAPLVTLFMSTYNSGPAVEAAVDSMLAQTYPNLEVVVVDDGSKDDTPARLRRYGSRIRLIEQANGGIARARNACLEAARGDYVAWFDHDDINEPQRIEWQMAYMRSQPDLLLSSTDFSAFGNEGPIGDSYGARYYEAIRNAPGGLRELFGEAGEMTLPLNGRPLLANGQPGPQPGTETFRTYRGRVFDTLALGNFIHPPTIIMKRELWDWVGRFDPAIRIQCDFEWLLRASRLGPFGYLDAPLLRYRIAPTQASNWRNDLQSAADICEVVERVGRWDPAYFAAHRRRLRRRQALWRVDAACTVVDADRPRARQLVLQSMKDGYFGRQTLRALAKAWLPLPIVNLLRDGKAD